MKRYKHPLDNPDITLFEAICDIDNLRLAHKNARKGKTWYKEVKEIDKDPDKYLYELKHVLESGQYKTSEYIRSEKKENGKIRKIYKLPYFPDRICQWAIVQVIREIMERKFIKTTYSSIRGRGQKACLDQLKKDLHCHQEQRFFLKIDIRHFYESIDHDLLKQMYGRIFKDAKLLNIIYEIIDSVPPEEGVPIGNFLSQYSGNLFLSQFDHWIKEEKRVKFYYRYMDDCVILGRNKESLHLLLKEIKEFLVIMKLTLKPNYQVAPISIRGIDFVGYRFFYNYILLRKRVKVAMRRKMKYVRRNINTLYEPLRKRIVCIFYSYYGLMLHCDSKKLFKKYMKDLQPHLL